MSTHYSKAQDPAHMSSWAQRAAIQLVEMWKGKELRVPVLLYSGMSGVASATALSLELAVRDIKFGMMYVRKVGEQSHGMAVEHYLPPVLEDEGFKRYEPVFVDDFTACGDTMRYCLKVLKQKRGEVGVDPERWVIPNAVLTLLSSYATAEYRNPGQGRE